MNVENLVEINIVKDILKRPDAQDSYLGIEVHNYLLENLEFNSIPTLIKIDIRNANPIDYQFTKSAFCHFYKLITENQLYDAIFYLRKSQVQSLFWGLLACIDGKIDRTGNFELDFIQANNLKICISNNEIQYKGKLNDQELEIHNFIIKNSIVENNTVYEIFKQTIPNEKITDAIRTLSNKKFIYWDEKSMPSIIYSVNSKI